MEADWPGLSQLPDFKPSFPQFRGKQWMEVAEIKAPVFCLGGGAVRGRRFGTSQHSSVQLLAQLFWDGSGEGLPLGSKNSSAGWCAASGLRVPIAESLESSPLLNAACLIAAG